MGHLERFKLTHLRVGPVTLARYDEDLQEFLDWAPNKRLQIENSEELDLLLTDFMVMLHDKNDGNRKQIAVNAKSALEFLFPRNKGPLSNSRQIVSRMEP